MGCRASGEGSVLGAGWPKHNLSRGRFHMRTSPVDFLEFQAGDTGLRLCDARAQVGTEGWYMARANFHWDDPLLLEAQLTPEEIMVRDAARAYAGECLAPRIVQAFREERPDPSVFREMGAIGLLGATIPETFGGAGLNYVSYGLIAREIERVDSGYRSMMSVQSSLVMLPIYQFGTEAQKH